MNKFLKTFNIICFVALCLAGCSSDNDLNFEGNDNFISSFKLVLPNSDGGVVTGSIVDEKITWKHCDGNILFSDAWNER